MFSRLFNWLATDTNQRVEPDRVPTNDEVIAAVDNSLTLDGLMQQTVSQRLASRVTTLNETKLSAEQAFENFTASRIAGSADVAARRAMAYVSNDGEFAEVQDTVYKGGVEAAQSNKKGSGIELRLSTELKQQLGLEGPVAGANLSLAKVWETLENNLPGYEFYRGPSLLDQCQAEVRLKAVTAQVGAGSASTESSSLEEETDTSGGIPAAPGDGIAAQVDALLQTITPPESKVLYGVPHRAEQTDVDKATSAFSLRSGPADVAAYHDFYDLQIAFQHVWTEIFDKELKLLGALLYMALVDWRNELGVKIDTETVSSVDSLKQVMADIRRASAQIAEADPRLKMVIQLVPELTAETWSSLTESQKAALYDLANLQSNPIYSIFNMKPPADLADKARAIIRAVELLPQKKSRVEKMLADLEQRLKEKYRFDVFYANPETQKYSINFGILVNYRQRWQPLSYQVGELVATVPLAPKETRKYTTRRVVKKSRAEKEIENSLQVRREESANTARSHAEIVRRANNKTNFRHNAEGGVNFAVWNAKGSHGVTIDSAKQSAQSKKAFRESVLKSAEEYKNEHRMEVSATESEETVETNAGEISNPNDELPVTYLFYELQRRFEISEQIHKLTPVIMVANQVPRPDEIDEDWLLAHDWILRRVILDDSFLSALDYLSESFVGDEVAANVQRENLYTQIRVVERVSRQIRSSAGALEQARQSLDQAIQRYAGTQAESSGGLLSSIGSFLFGGSTDYSETYRIQMEAAKESFQRAEREQQLLQSRLETDVSSLQQAADKYAELLQQQMNRRTEILRLRAHVKANIIYYMQAIWDQEPADQRFFRLYDVDVFDITGHLASTITLSPLIGYALGDIQQGVQPGAAAGATFSATIPANINYTKRKLVEVADLDNLLGYKGNYMLFPLKQNNPITLYMMQDYLRLEGTLQIKDPDELGNFTVEELIATMQCVYAKDRQQYEQLKPTFETLILKKLANPNREKDVVIVPSDSLYIEALPGTHPILEDFKLIHRAVDVKKAQAEVRQEELDNLRMAARTLTGDYDDPDIERKIVVEGTPTSVSVGTGD